MNTKLISPRKLQLIPLFYLLIITLCIPCKASEEPASQSLNSTSQPLHTVPAKHCPFCDEKVIHKQKFAESDHVMSLVDIKPMQEGHLLIIPKRHVTYYHELTHAEQIEIGEQIQRIYKALYLTKGPLHYILLNKNGKLAGQSIPHAHVHFVPIFLDSDEAEHGFQSNVFMDTVHSLNLYFWSFMSTYLPRLTDEELATKVQEMKDAMLKLDETEKNSAPEHSESAAE